MYISSPELELIELAKAGPSPNMLLARDLVAHCHSLNGSVNATGVTALHWAAYNGHLELAQLLIDSGADIMAQTDKREYPAQWAADCTDSVPIYHSLNQRKALIYEILLHAGTPYHPSPRLQVKPFSNLRDSWFQSCSQAWKQWQQDGENIQHLTPRHLLQFSCHGTLANVLNASRWQGQESLLQALITDSTIPPGLLQHWLVTIPGLAAILPSPSPTVHALIWLGHSAPRSGADKTP